MNWVTIKKHVFKWKEIPKGSGSVHQIINDEKPTTFVLINTDDIRKLERSNNLTVITYKNGDTDITSTDLPKILGKEL